MRRTLYRWRAVVPAAVLVAGVAGCSAAPSVPAGTSATDVTSSVASVSPRPAEAGTPQCRLDDLTARLTEPNTVLEPVQIRVLWQNRSDHACTMDGFGGVDLVNDRGERMSVLRADDGPMPSTVVERTPATVRLAPGTYAHSTIAYTSQGGTGTFRPVAVLATPPNETRSARLDWTAQAIPTFPRPDAYELSLGPVSPNVS